MFETGGFLGGLLECVGKFSINGQLTVEQKICKIPNTT